MAKILSNKLFTNVKLTSNNNTNIYICRTGKMCSTTVGFMISALKFLFLFCFLASSFLAFFLFIFSWFLPSLLACCLHISSCNFFFSPLPIAEIKQAWSCTSTPDTFMACRGTTLSVLRIHSRYCIKDCNCDDHTGAGSRSQHCIATLFESCQSVSLFTHMGDRPSPVTVM